MEGKEFLLSGCIMYYSRINEMLMGNIFGVGGWCVDSLTIVYTSSVLLVRYLLS